MEATPSKSKSGKDVKSISHALSILNDAARDSAEDIRDMVEKDYSTLRQTFQSFRPEANRAWNEAKDASRESVERTRRQIEEASRQAVRTVDESAHANPWTFVGAAAGIAALGGFLLGRRSCRGRA